MLVYLYVLSHVGVLYQFFSECLYLLKSFHSFFFLVFIFSVHDYSCWYPTEGARDMGGFLDFFIQECCAIPTSLELL